MKKIGSEKLLLSHTENNPRNGEGAFLRLKDGRIMYAYTKYNGIGGSDHDTAYIAAVYSSDEGESWSTDSVLYAKPEGAMNIMSVSLLRMANGDLGLVFLRKDKACDKITCVPYLYRSSDEGKTFDGGTLMIADPDYYVLNNDRIIRLKSGRLLFTVARHSIKANEKTESGVIEVYMSDDDGRSFRLAAGSGLKTPLKINDRGLMEPGLLELPDGRVWLYIRTDYGYQYESFSADGGETFTSPVPNYKFTSPESPMLAKNVGGYTVAILNPMPTPGAISLKSFWWDKRFDRTPLVCAVSLDGGLSFVDGDLTNRKSALLPFVEQCYYLEDNLEESYCYPAIFELDDGFLAAYYFSNGSGRNLASGKIIKVNYSELN